MSDKMKLAKLAMLKELIKTMHSGMSEAHKLPHEMIDENKGNPMHEEALEEEGEESPLDEAMESNSEQEREDAQGEELHNDVRSFFKSKPKPMAKKSVSVVAMAAKAKPAKKGFPHKK